MTARHRSANFSFDDKNHLLAIIDNKKFIVENKKTDAVTQHFKDATWMQIANDYNSIASIPRTAENLKTCYDNLKKRYRDTKRCPKDPKKSFFYDRKQLTEYEKILNKKIGSILAATQDQGRTLNDSNSLNKEFTMDQDKDLDDSQSSCSSEDSLHSETKLKEYSERSRLKRNEEDENVENEASSGSKTDVPCVLMLTSQDLNSDSETLIENNTKILEFSPQAIRNSMNLEGIRPQKINKNASKKQYQRMKDMNYAIAEAKLELVKLTKEHAVAEEKRKAELHEFQIQEAKLKVELMKLQLLNKKSQWL